MIVLSPKNGETVKTAPVYTVRFNNCKNFREIKKYIRKLAKAGFKDDVLTYPLPVSFAWEGESGNHILKIREKANDKAEIKIVTDGCRAQVNNLKQGTEYIWSVDESEEYSFYTENVFPRWIDVDGGHNVRDIGGRKNTGGQTVRQGICYRGIRPEIFSEKGIAELRKLGIKTQIDLRKEAVGKFETSPIGENVKYISYVIDGYEDFTDKDSPETIKGIIEMFADESIYPVYFHCHGGADRTGTLALMLGVVFGFDSETLLREYELTMMSNPEKKMSRCRKHKIKPMIKSLHKRYGKKTPLNECALRFMKDCGVTEECMNEIRRIFGVEKSCDVC